jgi:hypothetical protein
MLSLSAELPLWTGGVHDRLMTCWDHGLGQADLSRTTRGPGRLHPVSDRPRQGRRVNPKELAAGDGAPQRTTWSTRRSSSGQEYSPRRSRCSGGGEARRLLPDRAHDDAGDPLRRAGCLDGRQAGHSPAEYAGAADGAAGASPVPASASTRCGGDPAENTRVQNQDTIIVQGVDPLVFRPGRGAKPGGYTLGEETNILEGTTIAGGFTDKGGARPDPGDPLTRRGRRSSRST